MTTELPNADERSEASSEATDADVRAAVESASESRIPGPTLLRGVAVVAGWTVGMLAPQPAGVLMGVAVAVAVAAPATPTDHGRGGA
jgi:hypothetical protein